MTGDYYYYNYNNETISSNDMHQKLEKELDTFLKDKLSHKKKTVSEQEKVKELTDWYQKKVQKQGGGKMKKDHTLMAITNALIKILLSYPKQNLEKLLVDNITVEVEKNDSQKGETVIKNVEFELALKPSIDFVQKFNGQECARIAISFKFSASAKLENIRIHRIRRQEQPSQRQELEVHVEKFKAPLTISISSIQASTPVTPLTETLDKPIDICQEEVFKVEDFTLHLHR